MIPDRDRLIQALDDHERWFSSGGKSGVRADLSNCDLSSYRDDLIGRDLTGAFTHNTVF